MPNCLLILPSAEFSFTFSPGLPSDILLKDSSAIWAIICYASVGVLFIRVPPHAVFSNCISIRVSPTLKCWIICNVRDLVLWAFGEQLLESGVVFMELFFGPYFDAPNFSPYGLNYGDGRVLLEKFCVQHDPCCYFSWWKHIDPIPNFVFTSVWEG